MNTTNTLNVLFIGDIVGDSGLNIAVEMIPQLIMEYQIHFTIVNIENAKGGKGGSIEAVERLLEAGANVFTGGNHTWDNFAFHETLRTRSDTLRPINYPPGVYGRGMGVYNLPDQLGRIGVINLQGRMFMNQIECPFRKVDAALQKIQDVKYVIVDMHAEATAEKIAMAWYLDGRVSAILGTHSHVQTADFQIFPHGTAYCTDVGMTGPYNSVIGMVTKSAIDRFLYQTPHKYECANSDPRLCGAKESGLNKASEWFVGLFSTVVGCVIPFLAGVQLFLTFEPTTSAVVSVMNWMTVGSLSFQSVLSTPLAPDVLLVVTSLLFFACTGKSAQFPLFTWLPDAMAGPTPVSALIHAATMVTSGLFLTARLSPLFLQSPEVSFFVLNIGLLTAIFAAVVAFVQTDIKKVLAYSTVSQLGFMFMAVGVGATHLAIFHVVTHAFFKACFFLASGSVIHSLNGEQDVRKMGGLWREMPITAAAFFVASLSLAGIPLTAGFFSKDAIVVSLFASNYTLLYGIAVIVAGLTAAYSMKLFVLVFMGKPRSKDVLHAHESWVMTLPLVILALLAVFGGLIGLPETVTESSFIVDWLLKGSVFVNPNTHKLSHSSEWFLMGVSSIIAIIGVIIGYAIAKKRINTDRV
ncbi:hypothetical protein CHS0354_000697 [Potamilus streckersoni]|uniref:NADH:ubiquinone reductase (H(+)-translocating) n=1 Tax=Potamilus streckersoni TaxID=2493646 RepID=A0AAE0T789_9BIVA|nr:hypothetical protein CHS0354_000697 [Potamilus streckersoni]